MLGQFEVSNWAELLVTGNAGALARQSVGRHTFERKTRSRFALNAGEGARVPSTKLSLQLKLAHYQLDFAIWTANWIYATLLSNPLQSCDPELGCHRASLN